MVLDILSEGNTRGIFIGAETHGSFIHAEEGFKLWSKGHMSKENGKNEPKSAGGDDNNSL